MSKSLRYLLLLSFLILSSSCNQSPTAEIDTDPVQATESPAPPPTTTFNSPVSPLSTSSSVSPIATPYALNIPDSSLPEELTSLPLAGEMIYRQQDKEYRAPYISVPFYTTLTWTDIAWDGDKGIWAVNNETKNLVHFDMETEKMTGEIAFPEELGQTASLSGLTWAEDQLWAVNTSTRTVYKIDPGTGEFIEQFQVTGIPQGLAWGGDGLWLVNREALQVEKWSPDGKQIVSFAIGGVWPTGLAWDGQHLWFSDGNTGKIAVFDLNTSLAHEIEALDILADDQTFIGLTWMDGYLWIMAENSQRLYRFDVSQLKP